MHRELPYPFGIVAVMVSEKRGPALVASRCHRLLFVARSRDDVPRPYVISRPMFGFSISSIDSALCVRSNKVKRCFGHIKLPYPVENIIRCLLRSQVTKIQLQTHLNTYKCNLQPYL